MEIKVWQSPSAYFLNIGPLQVKLTDEEYEALWTAVYCETPASVLWTSCFDRELASEMGFEDDQLDGIVRTLNKSVERSFDL